MALQWPAPLIASGGINPYGGAYVGFSTAQPVGLPIFESPIAATTKEYTFDQEWMQYRANFAATALNTAHPSTGLTPDYSAFVLVNEGPRRDIGGGLVQWTRKYAIVPDSYDDFQSVAYNFIGFIGIIAMGNFWQFTGVTQVTVTGRPRVTWKVDCRVHYDFFLVGTGGSYTDAGGIPSIKRQRYLGPAIASVGVDSDWVMDAAAGLTATTPDRTTYSGWVVNAATPVTGGWLCGVAPGGSNPGQIVSEDSILTRLWGNIWQRQSFYVLAQ